LEQELWITSGLVDGTAEMDITFSEEDIRFISGVDRIR
jgi:hypothetical protein